MGWIKDLSDAHVKIATIFTKLETLQSGVTGLSKDTQQLAVALAEVKGAIANSPTSELLRQIDELRGRVIALDTRLARIEFSVPDTPTISLTPKRDGHAVTSRPGSPE